MKQFTDFLPVVAFVVAYLVYDIYVATAALMVAAGAQMIIFKIAGWKITRQMWLVLLAALVFGGLTLLVRDKIFIQWRTTAVHWGLAAFLIGSRFVGQGHFIRNLFGRVMQLPDAAWRTLTWLWGLGYLASGAANLWVAYGFSEQFWVAYKLVAGLSLPFVLLAASAIYLAKTGQLPQVAEAAEDAASDDDAAQERGGMQGHPQGENKP